MYFDEDEGEYRYEEPELVLIPVLIPIKDD